MQHPARLDLLCCLLDGGPLAAEQLSARTNQPQQAVAHNLELLEVFDLVDRLGDVDGIEPLYALKLDGHPDWVREAIEEHRRSQAE